MRLCFLGESDSPHVTRWLKHFSERGHEVHFVAVNPVRERLDGITYHDLQPKPNIPRIRLWIELPGLKALLRAIQPDILHAHYIGHYGWLAAFSGFHPIVLTAWGSDIYQERRAMARRLTHWSLQRADLIMGDSADLCQALIQSGAPAERVSLIQMGVDLQRFHAGMNTESLRRQLGFGDGAVIFCPRRSRPLYNIDTIIQAIPQVLEQAPDAQFILRDQLGDELKNDCVPSLKKIVGDLNIGHAVRFVGQLSADDLAQYYNLSSILVSVPTTDGTPVSVLEAMACGTVPVVSDVPSLREWIQNDENGFLVAVRDANELARALLCLLKDEAKRKRMAERNLELVRSKADREQWMQRVEEQYQRLKHER